MTAAVGFVGLGDMGSVLAGNLVATGHIVTTHDIAGPGRNPGGFGGPGMGQPVRP